MATITVELLNDFAGKFAAKITSLFVKKEEGKGLSSEDYTSEEKEKLGGIAEGANNYTHPTSAGNKHIPSGGASGQILRYSAAGTAAWGEENNTEYDEMTGASASAAGKAGLVPAPAAGKQGEFLRGDGTWANPTAGLTEGTTADIDNIIAGIFTS